MTLLRIWMFMSFIRQYHEIVVEIQHLDVHTDVFAEDELVIINEIMSIAAKFVVASRARAWFYVSDHFIMISILSKAISYTFIFQIDKSSELYGYHWIWVCMIWLIYSQSSTSFLKIDGLLMMMSYWSSRQSRSYLDLMIVHYCEHQFRFDCKWISVLNDFDTIHRHVFRVHPQITLLKSRVDPLISDLVVFLSIQSLRRNFSHKRFS